MTTTKLVYKNDTGEAVSIGTVVADPVPDGLTAVVLTDAERDGFRSGAKRWDATSRTVVATPGWVDPAIGEANGATLREQAVTAMDNNRTYVAVASPTAAQTTAQVKALSRQVNGVFRLVLNKLDGVD